jgi:Ca-activated chloride channel family protein
MNGGFRFASPWWLLALVLVALLAWWRGRRGRTATLTFSSNALLRAAARPVRGGPGRWLAGLRLLALALLALALARPQVEKAETREDARGINIMLTLDFSGTMRTRDFFLDGRHVARAEGMKRISAEFIRSRPNDRIGLVSFDRDAYLASPLTLDHDWLLERLQHETNGHGTELGSGLVVGAEHLQRHTNETRVLVLMTDAENISGGPDPETVADSLRALGIRIYCIQILSPGSGNPSGDLSELLTRAAVRSGGEFYRVRSGPDLRAVYTQIDRQEKQKLSDRKQKGWRELFGWLALPALTLLLLEQGLAHTRWRRLP